MPAPPLLANGSVGRHSFFEIPTQARINIKPFANANCERGYAHLRAAKESELNDHRPSENQVAHGRSNPTIEGWKQHEAVALALWDLLEQNARAGFLFEAYRGSVPADGAVERATLSNGRARYPFPDRVAIPRRSSRERSN